MLQQLETAKRDLDAARARRDALVREAAEAKVPKTHIAAAVGLSAVHVHRLLKPQPPVDAETHDS